MDYIKENFKPEKIEHDVIQRGKSEKYNADNHLNPVKGFDLESNKKVVDVVEEMKNIGFQGKHLGDSIDVLKKMKQENATIFMSFTSNMASSGLREVFSQLVKEKLIDVIITSTGAIEEDIMKCNKPFLLGDFDVSDIDLHKKGINRIGNIFVPDDRYEQLEDVLMPFFSELFEKQKKTGKMINPSELVFELGKKVQDENSILYWATKNDIPIFCPGITDGALGLQLYFFKQKNPEFGMDVTGDMKKLADQVLHADKTAGIILGGGIAKHHLIGVNILRDGLDYAIYVTTGSQGDGSLSGARPKEAKSWSKLKEQGNNVCIEGDATIVFPLLAICMKEVFR
ncbi:deoxyhypusine synthase [Candidatus Woesearchaeota archaeon]|nr:deoxyhypusine synthase [Candidatus Woesearchaeota archaeon]